MHTTDGCIIDCRMCNKRKSSQNKKDLKDVTAAPFLVSFSQLAVAKQNHQKQGSRDVINKMKDVSCGQHKKTRPHHNST